jgi:hypothetical protein
VCLLHCMRASFGFASAELRDAVSMAASEGALITRGG